jgi:hypothetical protein
MALGVIVVIALVVMSITGPAIGNIFSGTVSGLSGGGGYTNQEVANEPAGGLPADGLFADESGRFQVSGEQERVILKSAWLNLTVSDPQSRLSEIAILADEMGGWVVTSSSNQFTNSAGEKVTRGSITIRVPAVRLNEAMSRIKEGAGNINSESQSGEDVTQQYVDLSSRLKNLEAAETQLQTIMDGARKTEDVLSVYNELVRVRGEIESIKGQLQYYDEASSFSSIQIDLLPPEPGPVEAQTTNWTPAKAAENALGALVSVVRTGVDVTVSLLVFFGPIVIVLAVFWTLYRLARRRRTA